MLYDYARTVSLHPDDIPGAESFCAFYTQYTVLNKNETILNRLSDWQDAA